MSYRARNARKAVTRHYREKQVAEYLEHLKKQKRAEVDENGCYSMPDGSCVSEGPCIHTAAEPVAPVLLEPDPSITADTARNP